MGNARTINSDKPGESLVEVLDLKGLRYNIIVAVFFIPCTSHELLVCSAVSVPAERRSSSRRVLGSVRARRCSLCFILAHLQTCSSNSRATLPSSTSRRPSGSHAL